MGEIDDFYKQEVEDLDSNFLEKLKNSKDHAKSFKNYRENLKKCREKFSKNYTKLNKREVKRLRVIKKMVKEPDKFQHLVINHFELEAGRLDKLKMGWDVWVFNFGRRLKRFFVWIFPSWMIYAWSKIKYTFGSLWRDFAEVVENFRKWVVELIVKSSLWVWGILKWSWTFILSKKILFWRNMEKKEGDKKEGGGNNTEEKEVEEKKEG